MHMIKGSLKLLKKLREERCCFLGMFLVNTCRYTIIIVDLTLKLQCFDHTRRMLSIKRVMSCVWEIKKHLPSFQVNWERDCSIIITCWQAVPIMITKLPQKIYHPYIWRLIPHWTLSNLSPQPLNTPQPSAWEPLSQRSCRMPSYFHHFHSLSCQGRADWNLPKPGQNPP